MNLVIGLVTPLESAIYFTFSTLRYDLMCLIQGNPCISSKTFSLCCHCITILLNLLEVPRSGSFWSRFFDEHFTVNADGNSSGFHHSSISGLSLSRKNILICLRWVPLPNRRAAARLQSTLTSRHETTTTFGSQLGRAGETRRVSEFRCSSVFRFFLMLWFVGNLLLSCQLFWRERRRTSIYNQLDSDDCEFSFVF